MQGQAQLPLPCQHHMPQCLHNETPDAAMQARGGSVALGSGCPGGRQKRAAGGGRGSREQQVSCGRVGRHPHAIDKIV